MRSQLPTSAPSCRSPCPGSRSSFQLSSCHKEAASRSVLIPTLVNNNEFQSLCVQTSFATVPHRDRATFPAMIVNSDSRKTNHPALIVSLIILVVSFVGVIVFLACCSECPRRPIFRRARVPDELSPEKPLRPGTTPSSAPIAIPGAVARPRHRSDDERECSDAQVSSSGAISSQGSGEEAEAEAERSGPDSVPSEYLRGSFPRYL